jgi:molybdopterin-guanine dinucleotide biosynthesis protein A
MNQHTADNRAAITAVILDGGAGSRMGFRDKAWLQWRDHPFIAHIVAGLRAQVGAIAINSNHPERFQALALPLIADPFTDRRGPLAGILAGLEYSSTELVLFAPCDNPLVAPELAQRLQRSLCAGTADIAYAGVGADEHYLCALIRRNLGASLRRYLEGGGRAVRHWYAGERCCRVNFDDRAEYFANINTEADLARLTENG